MQSRIKQLDKIDRIEIEEEDNSSMRFFFPPAPRSGKVVIEARNLGKSFGDKEVFKDANFFVERGKKIAFVGKNGEGKTTMTKILVGELEHEGELVIGHNVEVAYFAQNQADELDKELTVFETIDKAAHGEIRKKVRNLLGAFMFGGEEADKKVKVLSGGERARVALCKLLLEPVNLLILDEPTEGIQPSIIKDIGNAIRLLAARGDMAILLVEQYYDFAKDLADHYIILQRGEVIKSGLGEDMDADNVRHYLSV